MCKIVKYWFACQHGFGLRISKCGGTKHKKVRDGLIVACKSDSYLNIMFVIDCGPCQHQALEGNWQRKLSLAEKFLQKLKDNDFSGVQEVAALVEQLKEEFNTASWNSRLHFPPLHKERCIRVDLGYFEKAPSPLRKEVLPEDITEPVESIRFDYPNYHYDWKSVAGTDPLYPVNVANYIHPLDDADPGWRLDHLSYDGLNSVSDKAGFDANEATQFSIEDDQMSRLKTAVWTEDADAWCQTELSFTNIQGAKPDRRYYSEIGMPMLSPPDSLNTAPKARKVHSQLVEMVMCAFWKVVNDENVLGQSSQQNQFQSDDLASLFNKLYFSGSSSTLHGLGSDLYAPPPTPPNLSVDDSCDKDLYIGTLSALRKRQFSCQNSTLHQGKVSTDVPASHASPYLGVPVTV